MAETVASFEFLGRGFKGGKYPWDEWLNGEIWKLKVGEDFTIDARMLQAQAYIAASKRRKKVRTRRETEFVYLQAYDA